MHTTKWTAQTILEFLEAHTDELRAMGVHKIGLFGSYVRNEQQSASDIDLLFSLDPFTWSGWMDVWNFLEDRLGTAIDLIPEKDLRPELRPYILKEVVYVENL